MRRGIYTDIYWHTNGCWPKRTTGLFFPSTNTTQRAFARHSGKDVNLRKMGGGESSYQVYNIIHITYDYSFAVWPAVLNLCYIYSSDEWITRHCFCITSICTGERVSVRKKCLAHTSCNNHVSMRERTAMRVNRPAVFYTKKPYKYESWQMKLNSPPLYLISYQTWKKPQGMAGVERERERE